MLAISTAWNCLFRHKNLKKAILEIKDLGLDTIEVGYNFTSEELEELIALIEDLDIKVSSVHNFCPLPEENNKRFFTELYRISSTNETERLKAVEYTKRTIDTALKLKAKAIVIHAGTVELDNKYIKRLFELWHLNSKENLQNYLKFKEEFLKLRKKHSSNFIKATLKSLEELVKYAQNNEIKIGLENRYYPHEIPNLEELFYFLEFFKDKSLVYWHDVGHAFVQERLGFYLFLEALEKLSKYLFGVHLHDIKGINDHWAPFSGEYDFFKLVPFIKNVELKVIEAHPKVEVSLLKEGIIKLKNLFN